MAQIGWFVFSGGGIIVFTSLAAVWLVWSRGSRAARRLMVGLVAFYWLAASGFTADALRALLAAPYAPLTRETVPAGTTAVVLLGSGGSGVLDWDGSQFAVSDRIGAARLLEAARVFRLVGADYIISSGGVGVVSRRARSSGIVMAEGLAALGVPKDRVVVEARSSNTRDEAVIIREMLATRPVDHIVLVTSQLHMRRSVGTFRAAGLETIPAIAREPENYDTGWLKAVPSDKALVETGLAAHEAAGIVVYALRGWYR